MPCCQNHVLLVFTAVASLGGAVTAEALRANIGSNRRFRSKGAVNPKFQVEGVAPTSHSSQKTRWVIFRMVEKSGQIFLQFCHNARVWQTDGRTDIQRDRSLLTRPSCIQCSAVKMQPKTAHLAGRLRYRNIKCSHAACRAGRRRVQWPQADSFILWMIEMDSGLAVTETAVVLSLKDQGGEITFHGYDLWPWRRDLPAVCAKMIRPFWICTCIPKMNSAGQRFWKKVFVLQTDRRKRN